MRPRRKRAARSQARSQPRVATNELAGGWGEGRVALLCETKSEVVLERS
jgi:hypothetical protein